MKVVKEIKMDSNFCEMLQAYFEDYRAKQDLITMIFEIHKFDEEGTVIESIPFKTYEKQFIEAKVKYDTLMEEIRNNLIPDEFKSIAYKFDVDFDEQVIKISIQEK